MNNLMTFAPLAVLSMLAGVSPFARGDTGSIASEEMVRELYVPFEDIAGLLENQPRRVLLSRSEYETLRRKARKEPKARAPRSIMFVSADYAITIERERAELVGTIAVELLDDGLHAVALDLSGVGLRAATVDGHGASIRRSEREGYTLFVEGLGRHELVLNMVARVETTAAHQSLSFQVPSPPATKMHLTVPGDVEIKQGAYVVNRVFDEEAQVTRFELLPKPARVSVVVDETAQVTRVVPAAPPGTVSLMMTLNNRLLQTRRVVVARSVIVDEITQAYERFHATFSMAILHRPVDHFRFALPNGFELTDVDSPLLSHWVVEPVAPPLVGGEAERILEVRLRRPVTETVVITLSGVSRGGVSRLANWTLPRIKPLEVAGHVAVVGLLLEDRLKLTTLTSEKLIPIDTSVLTQAFPSTLLCREAGKPRLRAVAAFYAPIGIGNGDVRGRFDRPSAELSVVTSVLLLLEENSLQVRGVFALRPEVEKIYSMDFSAPNAWHVESVADAAGNALSFEVHRFSVTEESRIRVHLPEGVVPGHEQDIYFQAVSTPSDWLSDWKSTQVVFPVFAVAGASRDVGAIAVHSGEDMTVYPLEKTLEGLTPLDEGETAAYGLAGVTASNDSPAYRYEAVPYQATFRVERIKPRLTARTYSFIRLDRDVLTAHYEIAYDIEEARTRRLSLLLPVATPPDILIRALDGVSIKEYEGTVVDGMRRWTILLAEGHRDTVRLAVDFEGELVAPPLVGGEPELELPIVRADGVVYQSGFVSVEGSAEVDLRITSHPRKVDVGELAGAAYRPDRSVLGPPRGGGVFAFVGDDPEVKVRLSRPPEHTLPPTIVQRAELVTLVSDDGLSQTAARFHLRTKAAFLQVELPEGSVLWSAELDGTPAKPQREGGRLLLSLPAKAADVLRDLRLIYETPVEKVAFWGDLNLSAPKLLLRTGGKDAPSIEVPVADLDWRLYLPTGFEIVRHAGTVTGDPLPTPEPAVWTMARFLYRLTGGVNLFYYLPQLSRARELSFRTTPDSIGISPSAEYAKRATSSRVERKARQSSADTRQTKKPKSRGRRKKSFRPAGPRGAAGGDEEFAQGLDDTETEGVRDAGDKPYSWALEGVRSLRIELEESGRAVAFRSLGHDPRLTVTLANDSRVRSLAWGLAMGVGVIGLALTSRPTRAKALYVVATLSAATLIPLVSSSPTLTYMANPAVYVVSLLVAFYLVARLLKSRVGIMRRSQPRFTSGPAATTAALALVLALGNTTQAGPPQLTGQGDDPLLVRLVESAQPVEVPDDAIIIPFDPQADSTTIPGIIEADQLLIPYRKYVELWDLAYPKDAVEVGDVSTGYALAGAAFTATLEGDEFLEVEGYLEIDLHTEGYVAVPLQIGGGVLAHAMLDGEPARLGVGRVVPAQQQQQIGQRQRESAMAMPLMLQVKGKGRHRLELTVRMKLLRQGGWSEVEGRLPAAPATALTLRVPRADTEVRLSGVQDRRNYETTSPGETIETALGSDGSVRIEWRPKVHEGYVDPSLTATSDALFDIREDGLRLTWEVNVDFGRTRRDAFTVMVPGDYLVQTVDGPNVRGWSMRPAEAMENGRQEQELQVTLLKPGRESSRVAIVLHRTTPIGDGESATFGVPTIRVPGAVLHKGRLTIRRSGLLNLQTIHAVGVTRTDISEDAIRLAGLAGDGRESPLGVQAYQAYGFVTVPFEVELTAKAVRPRLLVDLQTVLRIGERRRDLESRINISAGPHPVYKVRVAVPDGLKINHVSVPTAFEWSVTTEAHGKVLNVYLATGLQDQFSILIRGILGEQRVVDSLILPRLEVLDSEHQAGDIVVQVDPAFDIRVSDLHNCRETALERTYAWLAVEQRPLSRLALHYRSPDYAGLLQLTPREPLVTCTTITNVRVTEAAVEETVLLDFNIVRAGVRSISFLLPNWMKDSHITLPMLRQKTVEPVSDAPDAKVRVRLQLQDDVMGRLRVLVENDRLLTSQTQRVPIPTVETGRVERRFVTLENAGRDEVVIDELVGLEALSRQQKEWRTLTDLLGSSLIRAYVVNAQEPLLSFKTAERAVVATAGARIGIAETLFVADAHGAYRVTQSYRIDNRTEQFLEVELPKNAQLWSAQVAGDPVKPVRQPGAANLRQLRIPLIRTAAGDLDFVVVLKYGGRMPAPGALRRVEFPLIQTVNVPVELSQVRLFLPQTHRWLDFGGTMRQVLQKGDLAAGFVRYQTRLTQRLLRTMQSASPFAQVRAAANLAKLEFQMDQHRQEKSALVYNRNWARAIASNEATVRQAQQQSRQVTDRPQQRGEVEDNRARLNTLFENQRVTRARNQVQDLPGNFDQREQLRRQEQLRQDRFDSGWLGANLLSNVRAGELNEDLDGRQYEVLIDHDRGIVTRQAPDVAQQRRKGQLDQSGEKDERRQGKGRKRTRRGGTDEAVAQYQQQLQRQQQGVPKFEYSSGEDRSMVEGYADSMGAFSGADGIAADVAPVHPAGLVSLAVEFPLRGIPFHFTTPRGEVAITARAVSTRFVETLRHSGIALAVMVVLVVLYAALRQLSLSLLESRVWSTLLITLGAGGVVIGVLPVLGLVLVGVGVFARLNLRRRERAAVSA